MKRAPAWAELATYVAVALYGIRRALPSGWTVGDGVDAYGTLWFYWWMKESVLGLTDPSFTDRFFYPLGKDIFGHTGSNLLDAAVSIPFQVVLGNPGYQKWFVVAMLLANAYTFRPLARRVLGDHPWAVFAATLAWMLNPLILFEITCGRFTQAFLPFLPLALLHFLECEDKRSWKHPLLAGLFTALVGYTYWFYGIALAMVLFWLAVVGVVRSSSRTALLVRYAAAGAVCLLLVAPAAVEMATLAAAGEVPGITGFAQGSIFEPPPNVKNNVAQTLHGYLLLERHGPSVLMTLGTGLPLALWILVGPGRLRWLPAALIPLFFALGPTVEGHVLPPYMAAYWYLPFFQRLWFPYRLAMLTMVPAALAVGFLATRIRGRAVYSLPLVIFAVTAVEQSRFRIFPFVARDSSAPEVMTWIGETTGAIIDMPFGVYSEAVVWQTFHGQPLFGGMGENAPMLWPDGMRKRTRNAFVHSLLAAARNPSRAAKPYPDRTREKLEDEGYRWIVLHRGLVRQRAAEPVDMRALAVSRYRELLGAPTAVDGALVVWDLQGTAEPPEHLAATDERLAADFEIADPRPEYEIALQEAGRLTQGTR